MSELADIVKISRRMFFRSASVVFAMLVVGYRNAAGAVADTVDFLTARIETVFNRDRTMVFRKSQDNPAVIRVYDEFLGEPMSETSERLLHTTYIDRSGETLVADGRGVSATPVPVPEIRAIAPNPFNSSTTIRFELPFPARTSVAVYNVPGQKVRELLLGDLPPGTHTVTWNGLTEHGKRVSSGVYICRLQAGGHILARAMTFVK